MPRARRRRAARRSIGNVVALVVIVVIIGVVVVASIAEINAQSASYRQTANRSFGALATPIAIASTQTGRSLATTMTQASVPSSSRLTLQEQLDELVTESQTQASDAASLAPPAANGSLQQRFAYAIGERATATAALRTAVDGLFQMAPLPTVGLTATETPATPPPLTAAQATTRFLAVASLIQQADNDYAAVRRSLAHLPGPVSIPRSVWVVGQATTAPLGLIQLGASVPVLAASPSLAVVDQVVITAVGLSPPAVVASSPSAIGDGCTAPLSQAPGTAATVLPPTTTVSAQVTVTNCGNVAEHDLPVSASIAPDPGGTPGPVSSSSHATVSLTPGASTTVTLGGLRVASKGQYLVTLSVVPPVDQANQAGATQQFLVQIAA